MIGSPPPRNTLIPVKLADLPLPGRFPADLPNAGKGPNSPQTPRTPSDPQAPSGPLSPRSGERARVRGPQFQTATLSVGMAVALGAIAMTFAALLLAYAIVRVQSPTWPPPGEPSLMRGWAWNWLAAASVAALVGSAALRLAARTPESPAPRLLAVTAVSGVSFIAIQMTAWARLASDGFRPSSGLLASVVYALTLFHAVHAAVAIAVLLPTLVRSMRGSPNPAPTFQAVSSFWHLVTIAWLVVAVTVLVA